jgi:hypothetical protein
MKDSDLITKTVEGKSTSHHNIKSITFYCDGRHVSISLDSLRDNFRKARTEGILTETKDPHPYQSETEQKTPDHPLNYATMAILARIGKQAEFKEAWERLENAERNYICGDIYNIVKSACSHPYQSERDKVLDELEKRITEEEPVFLFTILGYIKELRRAGEP